MYRAPLLAVLWVTAAPLVAETLQYGRLNVYQADSGQWHTVHFDSPFSAPPVVVLGPLSFNSATPATTRVRNVTAVTFEFQIDEWDYLDGKHPSERLAFLAIAEGEHLIGGLRVIAGRVPTVDRTSQQVEFPGTPFTAAPAVFSQIDTAKDPSALVSRVSQISGAGFEIAAVSEEAVTRDLAAESVGYIAIELGSGDLGGAQIEAAATPARVGRGWSQIPFDAPRERPLIFAATQSIRETDPGALRIDAAGSDGFALRYREEKSSDDEMAHAKEDCVYLTISEPVAIGDEGQAKIELLEIEFEQSSATLWHPVDFSQVYQNPVVIAGPTTYNNAAPVTTRIREVTGTGFEFQLDEWDYLNGKHPRESLCFLVMEAGLFEIGGTRWEAGKVQRAAPAGRTRYFFDDFAAAPAVLCQLASANDTAAVVPRLGDITASRFTVSLAEEEAADGLHLEEEVHYVAVELGVGTFVDGTRFEAAETPTRHGGNFKTVSFSQNLVEPFFFAAAQSLREADPFSLRSRYQTGFGIQIRLHEEKSADSEMGHAGETLRYLAFSGGMDTDADGLPDGWEFAHGLDPDDGTDAITDSDGDGLQAIEEFRSNGDPNRSDSDGDGLLDGFEAAAGTLPNRGARDPFRKKNATGLVIFTPEPKPFDPAP